MLSETDSKTSLWLYLFGVGTKIQHHEGTKKKR